MPGIILGDRLRSSTGKAELDEIILAPALDQGGDGKPRRIEFNGDEHLLTIGPTRSGKGRRLLTPNLVLDTDRSVVVIDPKGELAKWTWTHRKGSGNEVLALDPFGLLEEMPEVGALSTGFNPLRWLDPSGTGSVDFVDDCTSIAEAICPVESHHDPIWDEAGQDLIAGLIMYHRLIDRDSSLADVRANFSRTTDQWRDLVIGDEHTGLTREGRPCVLKASIDHDCPVLLVKLGEFADMQPEDRMLQSIIRTAKTKTRFLDSPQIAADLTKPGIDFRDLKTKPMTVYLVLPPKQLITHAKWLRLAVTGAIEALRKTERNKNRPDVLFMLDEFPQLRRMQAVETGVQLNAGYGIKFWIVVQNITQLQGIYSDNWETFTSAGALTSYAPRDPTTSEYLSKLCGERTIDVVGDSLGRGERTISVNRQRRENIMPHQFRQMRKGMMFVRLPSDRQGERLYITDAKDFMDRDDIPKAVKALS